ncbi:MAG TPA: hypothetical protein VK469_08805 [Candidatus Kapabacteria bacterium]|nr:hypothetical protein [Candidatus Kapabacteria bacterium]
MITRISFLLASIIIFSSFVYSQSTEPTSWDNCNFTMEARDNIERWLNNSMKEVKKAVNEGREYNGEIFNLEEK